MCWLILFSCLFLMANCQWVNSIGTIRWLQHAYFAWMGGSLRLFFYQSGRQAIDLFPDGDKPIFYSMGGLTISPARNYIVMIQKWIPQMDMFKCKTFYKEKIHVGVKLLYFEALEFQICLSNNTCAQIFSDCFRGSINLLPVFAMCREFLRLYIDFTLR